MYYLDIIKGESRLNYLYGRQVLIKLQAVPEPLHYRKLVWYTQSTIARIEHQVSETGKEADI